SRRRHTRSYGDWSSDVCSSDLAPPTQESVGKFGLQVQELTKDVAERLHLPVQQGVVVTDVEDNSIAAAQDIQREDVITEVDGKRSEERRVGKESRHRCALDAGT